MFLLICKLYICIQNVFGHIFYSSRLHLYCQFRQFEVQKLAYLLILAAGGSSPYLSSVRGWRGWLGWQGDGGDGGDGGGEVDQGEVSTIRLGLLELSGFQKYSTLLVIQLFSRRLCLCHCLCIRLCLCICVPNSFLNSYYHKLSENVWVWGCGASRSEIWWDVTMAGQPNERTNKER